MRAQPRCTNAHGSTLCCMSAACGGARHMRVVSSVGRDGGALPLPKEAGTCVAGRTATRSLTWRARQAAGLPAPGGGGAAASVGGGAAAALRAGSSRREVVVAAAEQSLLSRLLAPVKAVLGRGAVYGSFLVAKQPARIRQARPVARQGEANVRTGRLLVWMAGEAVGSGLQLQHLRGLQGASLPGGRWAVRRALCSHCGVGQAQGWLVGCLKCAHPLKTNSHERVLVHKTLGKAVQKCPPCSQLI